MSDALRLTTDATFASGDRELYDVLTTSMDGSTTAQSRYPRVSAVVFDQPWAILPSKLDAICNLIERRTLATMKAIPDDIMATIQAASAAGGQSNRAGALAVVPVMGVLAQRLNLMSAISGGTSTEILRKQLRTLEADDSVSTVVLDIDSPGGEVFGTEELAGDIRAMTTRVVAQVSGTTASAAYWLASAADEIRMMPSGLVGSIGVVAKHVDVSSLEAHAGITTTLISAGEGKTDGADTVPLSDDARGKLQRTVDRYYARFVDAVVDGRNAAFRSQRSLGKRGISAETVQDAWKADVYTSERALELGLVDGIGDLADTISREQASLRAASADALRTRRGTRARLGV